MTHGDERIGLRVVKEIRKLKINNDILRIQISNNKAYKFKKRFVDQDLNRSFPGKKNGNYEQRLAYKLSTLIKFADLVIDIHSTKSELKDALIVTKINQKTLKYIKIINPKYVLIMGATKNNALISQAKVGIAFEYGKDNDSAVIKKTVVSIKKIFSYIGLIEYKFSIKAQKTKYFLVKSEVVKPKKYKLLKKIKNYRLVRKGETYATNGKDYLVAKESFYPILFGEKDYSDIFGFTGKKYNKIKK